MRIARDCMVIATIVAFVFSFPLGTLNAMAQLGGTFLQGNVTGTVLDASGNPVSGQTIKILDQNGNTVLVTNSGADGTFSLNSLPAGNYQIVIGNISAPLAVVSQLAEGVATAFEVISGGAVQGGLTTGTWALIGGVLVLGGIVASNAINKGNAS